MSKPRIHGDWIKAYIQHTQFSESPDIFHFWTAVSTIAGALRRRVWIDERQFQWTPNFYIIFVAPPGIATKSTSIRSGYTILERIKGVNFGPNSLTWQYLTDAFQRSQDSVQYKGKPRIFCALTCSVSELGTFLKPNDKDLMDVLTDMWDGQEVTWRRGTLQHGESEIKNPWLNLIGATTPAWLKENFPEVMLSGGLASRVIFVYADKKRRLVAYPSDYVHDSTYKDEEEKLVDDLRIIAQLRGEYTLTEEARQWGREWYETLWTKAEQGHNSERFAGYLSRKQGHLHKLAIVMAAARRNELTIEKQELVEADIIVSALEHDMDKIFDPIESSESTKHLNEVLKMIKVYKKIDKKDLYKLCFTLMSDKEFEANITACIKAGYVRLLSEQGCAFVEWVGQPEEH